MLSNVRPFTSWQNVNNLKAEPEKVERNVTAALKHLRFCVDLCARQWKAGRFFLFEHPMTAVSWASEMLHWLGSRDGVNKVSFDFCALGMRSTMPSGHEGPALKRTSVLTNSGHIGALLSKAKCRGMHEHVRLEDGRPAAAQIYPEIFCDAVCHGLKQELDDHKWLDKV